MLTGAARALACLGAAALCAAWGCAGETTSAGDAGLVEVRRLAVLLVLVAAIAAIAVVGLVRDWLLRRRLAHRTAQLDQELLQHLRTVEALRESEQRIRQIIATALDAVITMDARGLVTGWSEQAEKTFGWSRDEAIGRPMADLIIPPQYREAHRRGLAHFLETGEGPVLGRRIEITGPHRDGREIPIELSISPIHREGAYEFSAFVRDITERKRAEAELMQHRHHLEELVAQRTAELNQAKDVLAERVKELEAALAEVKILRGLLPICSFCHRIRQGEQYTKSVEAYLSDRGDARFTHGVCPECYEKHVRPYLEGK